MKTDMIHGADLDLAAVVDLGNILKADKRLHFRLSLSKYIIINNYRVIRFRLQGLFVYPA